jgi:hypothetical protein
MRYLKMKGVIGLVVLLTIVGLSFGSIPPARAGNGGHGPDLPYPLCGDLQVQPENRVAFRVYAVGVQIYRWNGESWSFVEPVATLYADADYHRKVGSHYAGPTWEGNDGSKVVATRLAGCTPDLTAIPWLLLQTVSTDGSGIFNSVTYIQRVNTIGGIAPTARGTSIGALAQIPYTTEYYFYRAKR